MDNIIWIVVADAAKARIFRSRNSVISNARGNGRDLTLINEFTHNDIFQKERDSEKNRMGDIFPLQLTKLLSNMRYKNNYCNLILVAPTAFMELLNKHLPEEINKLVTLRVEENCTKYNPQQLITQLQKLL